MWICENGSRCVDPCDDCEHYIEVEPVRHGKWVKVYRVCGIDVLKCSVCGGEHPRLATAFCCDCGARMDGGNNND